MNGRSKPSNSQQVPRGAPDGRTLHGEFSSLTVTCAGADGACPTSIRGRDGLATRLACYDTLCLASDERVEI